MKAIKPKFNPLTLNSSNIKVIIGLLVVLLILLSFATFRDTDTLITHDHANRLYTEGKIQKVIIDGDFIRLQTDTEKYKIYKDAINNTAFFTKYHV